MIWGTPAGWFLMALSGPIIGLFLYRRRAVLTVVPSLAYWVFRDAAVSGSPFGRTLRHFPTLLFQLLILGLLVAALADPRPPAEPLNEIAMVIDSSSTMQTSESGTTRLAQAVRIAQEIVRSASADSSFTLILAGQFPRVLLVRESDPTRVDSAIREIQPADVDSNLDEALACLSQILGSRTDSLTYLISDFCGIDAGRLQAGFPNVVLKQVGSTQPNLGIVDLRLVSMRRELAVVVGKNHPATRPFEIIVAPEHGEQVRYPGMTEKELTELRVPFSFGPGEQFQVSVSPTDSLLLDNVATGVVPAPPTRKIRLVSAGNAFLEQGILARDGATIEKVDPQEWTNDRGADVTIIDRPLLQGFSGLTGRFIVFSPVSDKPQPIRDMPVRFWLPEHPILRSIDPVAWGYIRGAPPAALPLSKTIVSSDSIPVVYEWPDPDSGNTDSQPAAGLNCRAVVFNFNLIDSELPYSPAFPVLLWDAIDHLCGDANTQESLAMPTGSVISTGATGRETPQIMLPSGQTERMSRSGNRFVWQQTDRQGIYSYSNEQCSHRVAVNWMSMRSTAPFVPIPSNVSPAIHRSSLASRISWRQLLAAVVFLVSLEWILFHRRILRMD